MKNESGPSTGEVLFLQLVSMFQAAAMQQLGKLIDPVTQKVNRDLGQAKISIDILDMIKEKTKGNLTEAETQFLDKVLFELHMNYVDESKRSEEDVTAGEEEEREHRADEPAPKEKAEGSKKRPGKAKGKRAKKRKA